MEPSFEPIELRSRHTLEASRKFFIFAYFGAPGPKSFFISFSLILAFFVAAGFFSGFDTFVCVCIALFALPILVRCRVLLSMLPKFVKSISINDAVEVYTFYPEHFELEYSKDMYYGKICFPYSAIHKVVSTTEFLLIYKDTGTVFPIFKPECDPDALAAVRNLLSTKVSSKSAKSSS